MNGVNTTELAVVRPSADIGIDLMEMLEKRNQLLDRILQFAVKATHPGQWTNLGGKPYPTGPACEAMGRRCAVSIDDIKREKLTSSDDRGQFYIYAYRARFFLPSGVDSIYAEGTCSSRDQFLGTDTAAGREFSEIDEGNIMKAAYTNCRNNGITQLLGVRNLSWERLAAAGIKKEDVTEVEYKHGAKGGGTSNGGDALKFGPGKGKTFRELSDQHLDVYRQAFLKDLADPEKERYHKNTMRQLNALEAESSARVNDARAKEQGAATTPPAATNGKPTPTPPPASSVYQRILALDAAKGFEEVDIQAAVQRVTGKTNMKVLTLEDLAKVETELKSIRGGESR